MVISYTIIYYRIIITSLINHTIIYCSFTFFVNNAQMIVTVTIRIGINALVRRMDFENFDPHLDDLIHALLDVGRELRMRRTNRNQPIRVSFAIFGNKFAHRVLKPHHLRRNIVHQSGSVNAFGIQIFQKLLWWS